MSVYDDLANLIGSYGNEITLHKHRSSEPHMIYYMYYNGYEFRYSFGSHGTYGILIKKPYGGTMGVMTEGNRWSKDDLISDLPEEIVGLIAEMKYYFEKIGER